MITLLGLADELDQSLMGVMNRAYECGFVSHRAALTNQAMLQELTEDQANELREWFNQDGPPYQWEVTEGGPSWTPDTRNEHDETL